MSYETIIREYLIDLQNAVRQANVSNQFTAELSYRPILDTLFGKITREVNPEIERVFEPRNQARSGRPDWRFNNANTLGVYGYVEAKSLNLAQEIVIGDYEKQVYKYLDLGHRVILTDGLEFVFFDPNTGVPARVSIVSKPTNLESLTTARHNPLLENHFRMFFQEERARRCSEEQLIRDVARRAVVLASSITDLSDLPESAGENESERRTIEALHRLKQIVENHHDPTLRNQKAFGDFVAQVLVFGLLYAHRVVYNPSDLPRERFSKIMQFWSDMSNNQYLEHLYSFRAISTLLESELGSLGPLGTWYEDCAFLLAYIDLDDQQVEAPDYHKLFEQFLAVFDPKTRFDFGAFYTPKELAKYTINLIKDIIQSELTAVKLFDTCNKLIDPCCGTGTFLEQLIVNSDNSSLPQIVGFEILPAPYALAHYRVSMLTRRVGYPHNLNIILTNTLSDELERQNDQQYGENLLADEQSKARECAQPPLTLVVGNPPSSDKVVSRTDGALFSIIQGLLNDFRPPVSERGARQNTQKQIQNEFVKFLRWSCNKLLQSKPGILALVLPSSFAEQTSYKYARKWLTENFTKLWLFDIDRDGRSGIRTSSLFNTLQGRLLLIAFTGYIKNEAEVEEIIYGSIADKPRQEKLTHLGKEWSPGDFVKDFLASPIDRNSWSFRPALQYDNEMYAHFWPLYPRAKNPENGEAYVFARQCSGIKLAPSGMFIHPNPGLLLRKLRDTANESNSVDNLMSTWFSGQAKPPARSKFTREVRTRIRQAISDTESITHYAFRPFVNMFTLISEPVLRELANEGGGGTRYRPEIIAAFENPDTIGLSISPAPKDIDAELNRFVSFCWAFPDNDLSARGNGRVFCNVFPEYSKRGNWNRTPVPNINPQLLTALSVNYSVDVDAVVFYVYGVLCSNSYLDAFEGALFTVVDTEQRPRIPFPAIPLTFSTISGLGRRLALLEKPEVRIDVSLRDEEINHMVFAFTRPFRLASFQIDSVSESIKFLDENRAAVLELRPVPDEILEFRVSGYNVVQTWLKFNSWPYTRAEFSKDNYDQFLDLLYKIREQTRLVNELDLEVSKLLSCREPLLDPI